MNDRTSTCVGCNLVYTRKNSNPYQSFCSKVCSNRARGHKSYAVFPEDMQINQIQEVLKKENHRGVVNAMDYVKDEMFFQPVLCLFACKKCFKARKRYVSRGQRKPLYCSLSCRPLPIRTFANRTVLQPQVFPTDALRTFACGIILGALICGACYTFVTRAAEQTYHPKLTESIKIQDFTNITSFELQAFAQTYAAAQNSNDNKSLVFIKTTSDGKNNTVSPVKFVAD